jgi:hypothetical protein
VLGVNRYRGVLWFNQQCYEQLLWWLLTTAAIEISTGREAELASTLAQAEGLLELLQRAEQASGYRVDHLLAAAGRLTEPSGTTGNASP